MARHGDEEGKVYVGGLPSDATAEELDEAFGRYGRLRKVWVARRPPGFAFIQFEDIRDAEDAVRALDGGKICGVRARVELSHGRGRGGGGGRGHRDDRGGRDYYGGYRADDRDRGYDRRGRDYSRSPRRSRSRSRSPKRRRSRSPSYEPQKDGRARSRSGERSRSRSRSPSR